MIRPLQHRVAIAASTALLSLSSSVHAIQPEPRKESQSAVVLGSGEILSSSALIKKLNTKLDNKYQDLEVVVHACQSGEFAARAKGAGGLQGTWSVSTSTDLSSNCNVRVATEIFRGKQGLKVGESFFHGYHAQYIRKLKSDAATAGNKSLHEFAEENRQQVGGDPQYESSGEAADNMTVRGGKSSNHAIVASGRSVLIRKLDDELVLTLKAVGYTDETITYLTARRTRTLSDGSTSDDAYSEASLDKALDQLRTDLDKHPGEEKAFLYFSGHGSYELRTVAFVDFDGRTPQSGFRITAATPGFDLFADAPELIAGLQEELPHPEGGFWADDPLLQRPGLPYLAFSTESESFASQSDVQVFLNNLLVGTLFMGNADGGDYLLHLGDDLLQFLLPDILASGRLGLSFALPSSADFFRLAVEADYLSAEKPHLMGYGVRLGSIIGSEYPVSEPGLTVVLFTGLGMLFAAGLRARCRQPR